MSVHIFGQKDMSCLREAMSSWHAKQTKDTSRSCLVEYFFTGLVEARFSFRGHRSQTCSKSKDPTACVSAFQAGLRQFLVQSLSGSCTWMALQVWLLPCRLCSALDRTWVSPLLVPCWFDLRFLRNWSVLWRIRVLDRDSLFRQDVCMPVCFSSQNLETLSQNRPMGSIVRWFY